MEWWYIQHILIFVGKGYLKNYPYIKRWHRYCWSGTSNFYIPMNLDAAINSWGFDVEVLCLARKLGFKIGIIPVYWKNDPRSHLKLSGYLDTLFEVVKIWWNLLWNKYGFRAAKAKRCLVDTSRIVRAVDSRTPLFSSALASLSHSEI